MSEKFIDQIEADRKAIEWLEAKGHELGAERIEWHTHETSGRTGSAWKGNTLLAVTVVLRDMLNWSVLTCHVNQPVPAKVTVDGVEYVPRSNVQIAPYGVRHIRACEVTDSQREQALGSDLYQRGDMVLIWANEGDLCKL